MNATISSKGQLVIPESIREQARLRQGDKVDIGYTDGLVVLRKRVPLSSAQVRAMLVGGNDLPELASTDEQEVAAVVTEARKARRRRKGAA
jgi:AbrB family looped-hinge helix DNA binding protein